MFGTYCDGVNRRDFLKAGTLGLLGLNLPTYLRHMAAAAASGQTADKSAIFIYLGGGQTHMDTWDLKPNAPDNIRGEFKPIATNVPGIEISEHLPYMAKQADKYAIVRSVAHNLAAHAPGQMFLRTGNRPLPSLQYPGYGSVVTKESAAQPGVPPYVALPITSTNGGAETAGYLGVAYNPFTVNDDPNKDKFSVRALALPQGLSMERVEARRGLLNGLDTAFRKVDVKSQDLAGMDKFYQQAYEILSAPKAREAFDISKEPADVRDKYGRNSFGQACLLARRLIEAGVRFVSLDFGGWDTHQKNFERLKTVLLPKLDQGMAVIRGIVGAGHVAQDGLDDDGGIRPDSQGQRQCRPRSLGASHVDRVGRRRHQGRPGDRPDQRQRRRAGGRSLQTGRCGRQLLSCSGHRSSQRIPDPDRTAGAHRPRRQGHQETICVGT